MGPHPTVAAIRLAVRRVLNDVLTAARETPGTTDATDHPPLVLAAVSGGADSMALAAALAFEAPDSAYAPARSPSTTACRPVRPAAPSRSPNGSAPSASTRSTPSA